MAVQWVVWKDFLMVVWKVVSMVVSRVELKGMRMVYTSADELAVCLAD